MLVVSGKLGTSWLYNARSPRVVFGDISEASVSSGDDRRLDGGSSSLESAYLRIDPFTTASSVASALRWQAPSELPIKSRARLRRGTDWVKLADVPSHTCLRLIMSRLSLTINGALASHTVVSRVVPKVSSLRYNDVHENAVRLLLCSLCVSVLLSEASSAGTVGGFLAN